MHLLSFYKCDLLFRFSQDKFIYFSLKKISGSLLKHTGYNTVTHVCLQKIMPRDNLSLYLVMCG